MNVVIFITCVSRKEAECIANSLVEEKLAACVNIVDKIDSLFWWQGKVDNASEILLIGKSKRSLVSGIVRTVKKLHSYQVPEIIALPIIGGNKDYLNWINESVRRSA